MGASRFSPAELGQHPWPQIRNEAPTTAQWVLDGREGHGARGVFVDQLEQPLCCRSRERLLRSILAECCQLLLNDLLAGDRRLRIGIGHAETKSSLQMMFPR